MDIRELLNYKKVTIQCHDNPDADAIASGFALYTYLKENNIEANLIYSGPFKLQKDNLRIFVDELKIPVVYVEPDDRVIEGLLITIDCQYGAKNVTKFEAEDVMIIDHHQYEIENIEKTYIVSNMGSCSTVVWQLLCEAGFDISGYKHLQTALYYGLYTDTGQFADISNPVDLDMKDALSFDSELIFKLQNSNISARELEIASDAMNSAVVDKEYRFAIVQSKPCDPNILGLISDFVLQVSEIDICVVFSKLEYGIKFSARSCVKETKADHLARIISKDVGSGGGHRYKAGGFIGLKDYKAVYGDLDYTAYFQKALKEYVTGYKIIDTEVDIFDTEGSALYQKRELTVGYVKATDILPVGSNVTVRTLEGDLHIEVNEGTHIMIGIMGEIYPINQEKLEKNYIKEDKPYRLKLKYSPKAKLIELGKEYNLLDYAKTCKTTDANTIYAKPLKGGVKIFTAWDRDCYMLGEAGDFIAAKADDLHDIYVIEKNIFEKTYQLLEAGSY